MAGYMRGDSVEERRFKGPIRGQLIFALLFFGFINLAYFPIGRSNKMGQENQICRPTPTLADDCRDGHGIFHWFTFYGDCRDRRILHVDLQEAKLWLQVN